MCLVPANRNFKLPCFLFHHPHNNTQIRPNQAPTSVPARDLISRSTNRTRACASAFCLCQPFSSDKNIFFRNRSLHPCPPSPLSAPKTACACCITCPAACRAAADLEILNHPSPVVPTSTFFGLCIIGQDAAASSPDGFMCLLRGWPDDGHLTVHASCVALRFSQHDSGGVRTYMHWRSLLRAGQQVGFLQPRPSEDYARPSSDCSSDVESMREVGPCGFHVLDFIIFIELI